MTAGDPARVVAHLVEEFELGLGGGFGVGGFEGGLVDEASPAGGVGARAEEDALGGEAVASGASGFLLVVLDGLGERGVDDASDVGAVDAHAEGDGCGDDVESFLCEVVLD